MKACTKCKESKELSEFGKDSSKRDGLEVRCRLCRSVIRRKNYLTNREKELTQSAKWATENRERKSEKSREYFEANKEKLTEYYRQWAVDNSAILRVKAMKRCIAKIQRTPKWLTEDDHKWISWHYKHAVAMEAYWGEPYEVDHIAPIQGAQVSGLHVPSNLQVITRTENRRKGAKYAVDT